MFKLFLFSSISEWLWVEKNSQLESIGETPDFFEISSDCINKTDDGIFLTGKGIPYTVASSVDQIKDKLPIKSLTIESWVSIDTPKEWGGIIGAIQDNADYEKGWILGYNKKSFMFGLSSKGSDDGNGKITYLDSDIKYKIGKWYHVVGTYDSQKMSLYINGKKVSSSNNQSGDILYDYNASLVIGGYLDSNESWGLDGRLRKVSLLNKVLTDEEIKERYEKNSSLVNMPALTNKRLFWEVKPFLSWPTSEGISVVMETSCLSTVSIFVSKEDNTYSKKYVNTDLKYKHEFLLRDLEPNTKYFYKVEASSTSGYKTQSIKSTLSAFRTAGNFQDSFTFSVVGDTQAQPNIVKKISSLIFENRPNLLIHAGDLVTTGTNKSHWTDHFFPNMQPLISFVPIMPVLGNHEQDAKEYYEYMSLPSPEKWYSFKYGNSEFFMIDGNRSLNEQSLQYEWLKENLSGSNATWKFAVLHQPPWTSDSNDYGDTWKENSTRGDLNARNIVNLLEVYGVDICFSGHVHDYERTFPIYENAVVPWKKGGVIYVTCAGGGGYLEEFDPVNTWFGNKKNNRYHYVHVSIHDDILEFQAIDIDGKLFDTFKLDKSIQKSYLKFK